MKKGGIGGGNTITGLIYEAKVDLKTFLSQQDDYKVTGFDVYYRGDIVAKLFKKYELYRYLESVGVDWTKHLSRQLVPDNCIYVIVKNTVYIIEVKYQQTTGSVDEKLQTCDFKKKQYTKLFSELNYRVEYMYILDDWFRQDRYKDVRDYVISVGCHYYYNYIPLHELGLPVPPAKKNQ